MKFLGVEVWKVRLGEDFCKVEAGAQKLALFAVPPENSFCFWQFRSSETQFGGGPGSNPAVSLYYFFCYSLEQLITAVHRFKKKSENKGSWSSWTAQNYFCFRILSIPPTLNHRNVNVLTNQLLLLPSTPRFMELTRIVSHTSINAIYFLTESWTWYSTKCHRVFVWHKPFLIEVYSQLRECAVDHDEKLFSQVLDKIVGPFNKLYKIINKSSAITYLTNMSADCLELSPWNRKSRECIFSGNIVCSRVVNESAFIAHWITIPTSLPSSFVNPVAVPLRHVHKSQIAFSTGITGPRFRFECTESCWRTTDSIAADVIFIAADFLSWKFQIIWELNLFFWNLYNLYQSFYYAVYESDWILHCACYFSKIRSIDFLLFWAVCVILAFFCELNFAILSIFSAYFSRFVATMYVSRWSSMCDVCEPGLWHSEFRLWH